jgi:hypothetical protein
MVENFEANLRPKQRGLGLRPARDREADSRIEAHVMESEAIVKIIEHAQEFDRRKEFLMNIDNRYIDARHRQEVQQMDKRINLIDALDHLQPRGARARARGFIEGDCRRMEDIRKEVFRRYAKDLQVRFFRAKACFVNDESVLEGQASTLPDMFKKAFKDVEAFGAKDFAKLPRDEIKPDDIQNVFDRRVRQIEHMLPKLLMRLEFDRGVADQDQQSTRLDELLERTNACEKKRSEQQPGGQGFPSEQFRLCHRSIISAVHEQIGRLERYNPIDSRASDRTPDALVLQFETQVGIHTQEEQLRIEAQAAQLRIEADAAQLRIEAERDRIRDLERQPRPTRRRDQSRYEGHGDPSRYEGYRDQSRYEGYREPSRHRERR